MTLPDWRCRDRPLHRRRISFRSAWAWTAHGRFLAAIEGTELDAALVGDPSDQTIECVHFPDQMTFPKTADGGIAGHRADSRELVGDQRCSSAHTRSRRRRLTAGVAATDDNDIEARDHDSFPNGRCLTQMRFQVKNKMPPRDPSKLFSRETLPTG